MKWTTITMLFLWFAVSGCESRERTEALNKKEMQLAEKEQQLLLREKTLELREADLVKREQLMDSIPVDSSKVVNPVLAGHWVVKMTCTETTCTGSAIGDTRTEQWEIVYQAENIIARAMMNGNLVRAYTGSYNGSMLELTETREQNTADPVTKMTVRLRLVDDNTMDGTREIIRENNCKVVFAMEMKKQ